MPVYQEKNKKKLPKNGYSWYFRCYYTDMYGNRKQKQSKMYEKRTLAKDAETEFLSKIKTTDEVDSNVSFEYVYNDWWETKKNVLKITTAYNTKLNTDKNILTFFKCYKLHSIKRNTIDEWLNKLASSNLSLNYENSMIGYLKEALLFAVDNYNFDKKVITKLQKKKNSNPVNIINDAELNFWTLEEFNTFISHVDDELDSLMYNFLYYTGLRLGEMIALTWNDVDLERKKLTITKSFSNRIRGKNYVITSPKTSNSKRIIDLDNKLTNMLKSHLKREKSIYNFNREMFLFGNVKHIAPTTFSNHLKKWINISKIKCITPHGFRHSHASLLIYLGCDSRDVADRLGDTVQVIEKTYAHLFPIKRTITINKLNEISKNKR